jgi:hypothetical protein
LPPAAANKQIKKQIAAIGRSRIRLREEPVQLRHIPACTKRNKSHRIRLHLLQLLHLLAAALAIGRCALDFVSQLLHTLHREAYGSLAAMQCIGSQRIPQRTMSASDTTRPSADADARRSSASVAAASARAARSVRSASALACSSHVARADVSSSCSVHNMPAFRARTEQSDSCTVTAECAFCSRVPLYTCTSVGARRGLHIAVVAARTCTKFSCSVAVSYASWMFCSASSCACNSRNVPSCIIFARSSSFRSFSPSSCPRLAV